MGILIYTIDNNAKCYRVMVENLAISSSITYAFILWLRNLASFLFKFYFIVFYIYLNVYILFVAPAGQNLLCSLLWLCWRGNIRGNKKDIALRLWDKYSYSEKFLALLPCTCYCKPRWFFSTRPLHYFQDPFPIVSSVNLRLLYSLPNREHINYIEVLGFLFFPYFSCVCSHFSVW
jgi:hypothetical protein